VALSQGSDDASGPSEPAIPGSEGDQGGGLAAMPGQALYMSSFADRELEDLLYAEDAWTMTRYA